MDAVSWRKGEILAPTGNRTMVVQSVAQMANGWERVQLRHFTLSVCASLELKFLKQDTLFLHPLVISIDAICDYKPK